VRRRPRLAGGGTCSSSSSRSRKQEHCCSATGAMGDTWQRSSLRSWHMQATGAEPEPTLPGTLPGLLASLQIGSHTSRSSGLAACAAAEEMLLSCCPRQAQLALFQQGVKHTAGPRMETCRPTPCLLLRTGCPPNLHVWTRLSGLRTGESHGTRPEGTLRGHQVFRQSV
jgi:hypothetical protein